MAFYLGVARTPLPGRWQVAASASVLHSLLLSAPAFLEGEEGDLSASLHLL